MSNDDIFEIDGESPQKALSRELWSDLREFLFNASDAEVAYERCVALEELVKRWVVDLGNDDTIDIETYKMDLYFVESDGVGGPEYEMTNDATLADEPSRHVPASLVGKLVTEVMGGPHSMGLLDVIGDIAADWQNRLGDDEKLTGHLVVSHNKGAELRGLDGEELYEVHRSSGDCEVG